MLQRFWISTFVQEEGTKGFSRELGNGQTVTAASRLSVQPPSRPAAERQKTFVSSAL
jgi:hypothetical protein